MELERASWLRAADAIHLAAAVHWGCDATLLTIDRAIQLAKAPIDLLRLEPNRPLSPPA